MALTSTALPLLRTRPRCRRSRSSIYLYDSHPAHAGLVEDLLVVVIVERPTQLDQHSRLVCVQVEPHLPALVLHVPVGQLHRDFLWRFVLHVLAAHRVRAPLLSRRTRPPATSPAPFRRTSPARRPRSRSRLPPTVLAHRTAETTLRRFPVDLHMDSTDE